MKAKKDNKTIFSGSLIDDGEELDGKLRPRLLKNFIGQDSIKKSLRVFIKATLDRNEPLDHVLIHGGPGLGKTTLAYIIAHELGKNIRSTSGPAIERTADLAAILTNLEQGDVLFIDEIHRLPRQVEEILYPAMEDYKLDLIIGKGPSAQTVSLEIPPFTLVGATTKAGMISSPLRDRFGIIEHLDFYNLADMEQIVTRSARILSIDCDRESIKEIAKRSRSTPRLANRLILRARDYSQVKGLNVINAKSAKQALEMLQIDDNGLNQLDRMVLRKIAEDFSGGPVGLSTLAASTAQEKETIEDVVEPYLMRLGFVQRTSKGRTITAKATKYLSLSLNKQFL